MGSHAQCCRQCKRVFELLLKEAAGEVLKQHSLELSAHLEDYRGKPFYESLHTIYCALQNHRNHQKFVRRRELGKFDYFLPKYKIAVEFDESQHFTAPRRLALALYPSEFVLGFDRQRWMDLCEKLDRHDRDPEYRDEQRAWLDVLRDFSSVLCKNRPTVRVYAGDKKWCMLEPACAESVEVFTRQFLPGLLDHDGKKA